MSSVDPTGTVAEMRVLFRLLFILDKLLEFEGGRSLSTKHTSHRQELIPVGFIRLLVYSIRSIGTVYERNRLSRLSPNCPRGPAIGRYLPGVYAPQCDALALTFHLPAVSPSDIGIAAWVITSLTRIPHFSSKLPSPSYCKSNENIRIWTGANIQYLT
jgi:hypothetical protein